MAKYKIKTHKGAQKRLHVTGTGKLMRTKGGKSHLRRKKAARTKRLFSETFPVATGEAKRLRKLIPYEV